MSAKKCNYIVFTQNKANFEFNLYLWKKKEKKLEEKIPKEENPVFLGVTIYKFLNFNTHFSNLFKKCQNRLNIIKILSRKYWKQDEQTLFQIYNLLIDSIYNYSFFTFPCLSEVRLKKTSKIR